MPEMKRPGRIERGDALSAAWLRKIADNVVQRITLSDGGTVRRVGNGIALQPKQRKRGANNTFLAELTDHWPNHTPDRYGLRECRYTGDGALEAVPAGEKTISETSRYAIDHKERTLGIGEYPDVAPSALPVLAWPGMDASGSPVYWFRPHTPPWVDLSTSAVYSSPGDNDIVFTISNVHRRFLEVDSDGVYLTSSKVAYTPASFYLIDASTAIGYSSIGGAVNITVAMRLRNRLRIWDAITSTWGAWSSWALGETVTETLSATSGDLSTQRWMHLHHVFWVPGSYQYHVGVKVTATVVTGAFAGAFTKLTAMELD